jgi:hypothetical protein
MGMTLTIPAVTPQINRSSSTRGMALPLQAGGLSAAPRFSSAPKRGEPQILGFARASDLSIFA